MQKVFSSNFCKDICKNENYHNHPLCVQEATPSNTIKHHHTFYVNTQPLLALCNYCVGDSIIVKEQEYSTP